MPKNGRPTDDDEEYEDDPPQAQQEPRPANAMLPHDEFGGLPPTHGCQWGTGLLACCCPCVPYGHIVRLVNGQEPAGAKPGGWADECNGPCVCFAFLALVGGSLLQSAMTPAILATPACWHHPPLLGGCLDPRLLTWLPVYCLPHCCLHLPLRRAAFKDTDESWCTSCLNTTLFCCCSLSSLWVWAAAHRLPQKGNALAGCLPCCCLPPIARAARPGMTAEPLLPWAGRRSAGEW